MTSQLEDRVFFLEDLTQIPSHSNRERSKPWAWLASHWAAPSQTSKLPTRSSLFAIMRWSCFLNSKTLALTQSKKTKMPWCSPHPPLQLFFRKQFFSTSHVCLSSYGNPPGCHSIIINIRKKDQSQKPWNCLLAPRSHMGQDVTWHRFAEVLKVPQNLWGVSKATEGQIPQWGTFFLLQPGVHGHSSPQM